MRNYLYRLITKCDHSFMTGLIRCVLWLISLVYRIVITAKNTFYSRGYLKSIDLVCPVISVGNITWGGVGKTPFVIFLAQYLKNKGHAPAILTRGYMTGSALSDEADLIRQEIPEMPVGVGADRVRSALQILREQPVDVFILDDGFQHRKIKRGLNVVLIDANDPFGNGELIPRGILREPFHALKRADVIVLTKTDVNPSAVRILEERLKKSFPVCPVAWAIHQPTSFEELSSGQKMSLSGLAAKSVIILSGIGDPRHFFEMLSKLVTVIKEDIIFPDHHIYSASDVQQIISKARLAGVEDVVTTAKDAVKLGCFKELFVNSGLKCWVLKINFEIKKGKDHIFGRVDHLLDR